MYYFASYNEMPDRTHARGLWLTTIVAVCSVKERNAFREALSENSTVRGSGVRSRRIEYIAYGNSCARLDGLAPDVVISHSRHLVQLLVGLILSRGRCKYNFSQYRGTVIGERAT